MVEYRKYLLTNSLPFSAYPKKNVTVSSYAIPPPPKKKQRVCGGGGGEWWSITSSKTVISVVTCDFPTLYNNHPV